MKNKLYKIYTILLTGLILSFGSACDDILVTRPENLRTAESQFANDALATEAIVGLYAKLNYPNGFNQTLVVDLPIYLCLYTDELFPAGTVDSNEREFFQNALTRSSSSAQTIWTNFYSIIYQANSLMDNVALSTGMTQPVKTQYTAEAKFIRAFCYFYLVNLYGAVPLVTTSDYRISSTLTRTPVEKVYEQVITDLTEAESVLSINYPTADRVRANKASASALLARVYLYTEDWAKAEEKATALISNTGVYALEPAYSSIFMNTSKEAIWQLWDINPYTQFRQRTGFRNSPFGQGADYGLQPNLVEAFEAGDKRKDAFTFEITTLDGEPLPEAPASRVTPSKYTRNAYSSADTTEYFMVFRLAEQYLIRAEARAQQKNITAGTEDVNALRARAGLPDINPLTVAELLLNIEHERRIELCYEWGDRFFNLKRTGRLDAVLSVVKPAWQTHAGFLPIPVNEFLNNPNLGKNNAGY